ncbi:MAG: antibiotic biosynthesis monooxygenase [Spirochaetales bacterium]|nr:antibiotic biosynthesis monooxygenase [Spirochaetales bacterium]
MYIVHVHVTVKREFIDAFKSASIKNAENSIREPGIQRFDVMQSMEEPAQFVLVEVYATKEETLLHKETNHYKKWRDTVENMMEKPRKSIKYVNLFPNDSNW